MIGQAIPVLRYLRRRAGTWGEFVHHNNDRGFGGGFCLVCGCRSYFAFCRSINVGHSSFTDPNSAYECARCGATFTSWDLWSQDFRIDHDRHVADARRLARRRAL